ncbi:MAG: glycosyltransferase family 2 protein [Candidatus Thermoplasmatota archaeon]|nr:glycosyltransferase family 2 protein [Candidatus Thermoplasmatota archaeon]
MSPDRDTSFKDDIILYSSDEDDFKVVVCMPAFNEENYVASTVLKCRRYCRNVFVVDDCSGDRTSEMAIKAGAKVVRHAENQGYGGALRSCFKIGQSENADCLVVIDSDGQHDPDHIPSLIEPVKKRKADIVIGSRFKSKDAMKEIPRYRMVGIQAITQTFNLGTNMSISDSQSGYRAYSKKALKEIRITTDRMDASMEVLFDANDAHLKIVEVPIVVKYEGLKGSSEAPLGHGFRVIGNTMRMVRERHPLRFFLYLGGFMIFLIPFVILYTQLNYEWNTGLLPIGTMFIVTFLGIIGSFLIFTGIMLHGVNRISAKMIDIIEK